MSIEDKIGKLTESVDRLVATMEAFVKAAGPQISGTPSEEFAPVGETKPEATGAHWEPSAAQKKLSEEASKRDVTGRTREAEEVVAKKTPAAKRGPAKKAPRSDDAGTPQHVVDTIHEKVPGEMVGGAKGVPAAEPTPATDDPYNRDKLQDLCLSLVRKDRTKKDKIKSIIRDHGGELLKDVQDDLLESLGDALMELNQ